MDWEIIGKALTAFIAIFILCALICYLVKYWEWVLYFKNKLSDKFAILFDDNYGEEELTGVTQQNDTNTDF